MILSKVLRIIPLLFLAACATASKSAPPMPNKVSVGVPTTCIPPSLGPAPTYPYPVAALLAEPKGPRLVVEMFEDFRLMAQRLGETEPAIDACRKSP